jgi:pimeloyl-ACP methyl ester carboxylesterase
LGAVAETSLANVPASSPVNLLRLAGALHGAGYQLLMFDLRNHGHSAASIPVTFGLHEADDLLGALDYLAGRQDVDDKNIGVIGFAMGANTILYSLPRTELIKAAVAVQPSSPTVFSRRYATSVLGPLGTLVLGLTELIYIAAGGVRLSAIEPVFTVMGAKNTPVLYIQGSGDPWGSVDNVAQMAAATPNATAPLLIDTDGHSGGYQYVVDNPEVIDSFFRQHIS